MSWSNEQEFIRFLQRLGFTGSSRVLGIGDDTAVLRRTSQHLLFTTDMMIEGVHFTRKTCAPEWLAHKLLARNVSDIAAMGGTPGSFVVSLGVPAGLPRDFLSRFYRGLKRAQRKFGAQLVGGDLSRSTGNLFSNLALLGSSSHSPILRQGARSNDSIWVSGPLGLSSTALQMLSSRRVKMDVTKSRLTFSTRLKSARASIYRLMESHFLPRPPWKTARELSATRLVTAMIDISDGLALDLHRLCDASGVGAVIRAEDIPIPRAVMEWADDPFGCALFGGEDYQLLFTAPSTADAKLRARGAGLHRIGRVVSGRSGVLLETGGKRRPLPASGFDHFQTALLSHRVSGQ